MQPPRTEEIRFSAARTVTRHLTWAQRLLWNDVQWLKPDHHFYNLALDIRVPEGRSTDAVLDALAALVQRHEALRTRFVISSTGDPVQHVTKSGSLPVTVLSVPAAEVDTAAGKWLDITHDVPFDFAEECATRIGLVEVAGSAVRVLLIISHIAVDGSGALALRADFDRLLTEGIEAPFTRIAAYQPLDRAAYEASPPGVRRSEKALRHWERTLATVPARMFTHPPHRTAEPRFVNVGMKSPAMSAALGILAERHRATSPAVLIAAAAAVLATATGNDNVLLKTISNNRFDEGLKDMVGMAVGNCVIAIPTGGHSFTEIIQYTGKAAVSALMHGQCDSVELYRRLDRRNHEHGVYTDVFEAFINDRRDLDPATAPKKLSVTELLRLSRTTTLYRDGSWKRQNAKFFLDAGPDPDTGGDLFHIMADTAFLSTAEIEQVLRGLEALLVTATGREVTAADIPPLTGVRPPERGTSWKLIDRCWVDVDRTTDVLRQVSGSDRTAVFAVDAHNKANQEGGQELVAYIRSENPWATPENIHHSFVAALAEHPSAMAPGRYVICRSAPEPPGDGAAAWDQQPVVRAGTGRTES